MCVDLQSLPKHESSLAMRGWRLINAEVPWMPACPVSAWRCSAPVQSLAVVVPHVLAEPMVQRLLFRFWVAGLGTLMTAFLVACGPPDSAVPEKCRVACYTEGRCALDDGQCVATKDEHCRNSGGCNYSGLCHLDNKKCVARNANDCTKNSTACAFEGRCVVVAGECVAASDQDCVDSVLCRSIGACRAVAGRCVR